MPSTLVLTRAPRRDGLFGCVHDSHLWISVYKLDCFVSAMTNPIISTYRNTENILNMQVATGFSKPNLAVIVSKKKTPTCTFSQISFDIKVNFVVYTFVLFFCSGPKFDHFKLQSGHSIMNHAHELKSLTSHYPFLILFYSFLFLSHPLHPSKHKHDHCIIKDQSKM